jgi:hypothetical protein
MPEPSRDSIGELIKELLDDARDLIREELALARMEIREEVSSARVTMLSFGVATFAALVGSIVLAFAIGGSLADLFDWPAWAGDLAVAGLLLVVAWGLVAHARRQLTRLRALPKTTASLKENLAWIQNKSSGK